MPNTYIISIIGYYETNKFEMKLTKVEKEVVERLCKLSEERADCYTPECTIRRKRTKRK